MSGFPGQSGSITDVTSTDGSITVTNPTGPTVNVETTTTGSITDVTSSGGTITVTNPTGPTVNVDVVASTAPVTRSGSGAPTIISTDQVGDMYIDYTNAIEYGPLGGTLTVSQPWTTAPATCPVAPFVGITVTHVTATGAHGNAVTTLAFTLTPGAVGNLLVLTHLDATGGQTVSSIATTGQGWATTAWTKQTVVPGGSLDSEVWTAVVTAVGTGNMTVTETFSGSAGPNDQIDEFACNLGAATVWTALANGAQNNASATAVPYPSLTASATPAAQIYCGGAIGQSVMTATNGTPAGFVYVTNTAENDAAFAYRLGLASTFAYTGTCNQATSHTSSAAAVIMGATFGLVPAAIPAFTRGTNTSGGAVVTTPTLGAAAQLAQTVADAMLYIVIGTAGTALTIAIGPTSGVATVLVNSVVATSGAMYTVRLPAGYFIKVTATTATWTTTAVIC